MAFYHKSILLLVLLSLSNVYSDPLLDLWNKTTAASTGYNGITGGIQKIQYSTNYVYVYTSGVPLYTIGPTWNNPNKPSDQKLWFKIPRNPSVASSKTKVGLGHIGVFLSGVTMFNADDGQSYNNKGYWTRNAYFWEGGSFDSCNGHAQQQGEYHQHINPVCQYTMSSIAHSPLLGYVFDGYPIYGPYSYTTATDMTSAIKRMVSSYVKRDLIARQNYADGTILSSSNWGPEVSSTYPVGAYLEDYYYSAGYGDLDAYNGRFTKTTDYPNGIYCYFATIDASGTPAYPFLVGPYYYGNVVTDNVGTGGKSAPSETVTTYYSFSNAFTVKSSIIQIIIFIVFANIFNLE